MEVVKQSSKGAILISQCSKELQKLLRKLETQIMDTVHLVDQIRQQAYEEHLDDFSLDLMVREILKPLNLSSKRKQEIIKQFKPVSPPKNLPDPATPVLIDELVDVWFAYTTIDMDIDKAKETLCDIIMNSSKDGLWIQMRKSRSEIVNISGDRSFEESV